MDETSCYYAKVKGIKELLRASESDDQCLFLLDELFKGTNTIERIASGKAVLSYLNRKDNLVFASHLTSTYNYFHFSELIENGALNFDYKLKNDQLSNANAIRILEINDFSKDVTNEARSLTNEMMEINKAP